jgi:2,4-diketo-3-deoxy-L-fuconate hydrolase
MKLLRYGLMGQERPGLLDSDGRIRDLSRDVADIGPDCLTSAGLVSFAKLDPRSLPLVDGAPRLGVPVARVGKFIAIGLNFVDHAAESNLPIPNEPVVFTKATSSLAGPNDRVMLPKDSARSDWEVELLKPGDVRTLGIEGLGEQRQEVIAWQRVGGGPSNGL